MIVTILVLLGFWIRLHIIVPDIVMIAKNEYHTAEVHSWRLRTVRYRSSSHYVVFNPNTFDQRVLRLDTRTYFALRRIARDRENDDSRSTSGRQNNYQTIIQQTRFYYLPNAGFVFDFTLL